MVKTLGDRSPGRRVASTRDEQRFRCRTLAHAWTMDCKMECYPHIAVGSLSRRRLPPNRCRLPVALYVRGKNKEMWVLPDGQPHNTNHIIPTLIGTNIPTII